MAAVVAQVVTVTVSTWAASLAPEMFSAACQGSAICSADMMVDAMAVASPDLETFSADSLESANCLVGATTARAVADFQVPETFSEICLG